MVWKHDSSPIRKKFKITASAGKVMATFWDSKGVIMTDYLSKSSTLTGPYYVDELRKLSEALKNQHRGKLRRGVLLLHDNAPAHTSTVATSAAAECGNELLPRIIAT